LPLQFGGSALAFREWVSSVLLKFLDVFDCATTFWRIFEYLEIMKALSEADVQHPILDLGCGEGNFAKKVFGSGFVDMGLDLSEQDLKKAKSLRTYCCVICGDARHMPLKSSTFKVVFSNSTLEHVPDLMRVLREIARVVDTGGFLIATVPSNKFRYYLFGSWVLDLVCLKRAAVLYGAQRNRFLNHFNCNSATEWEQMLTQVGLKPLYMKDYLPRTTVRVWDFMAIAQFMARKLGMSQGQLKVLWRLFCLPFLVRTLTLFLRSQEAGGALLFVARRGSMDRELGSACSRSGSPK